MDKYIPIDKDKDKKRNRPNSRLLSYVFDPLLSSCTLCMYVFKVTIPPWQIRQEQNRAGRTEAHDYGISYKA